MLPADFLGGHGISSRSGTASPVCVDAALCGVAALQKPFLYRLLPRHTISPKGRHWSLLARQVLQATLEARIVPDNLFCRPF